MVGGLFVLSFFLFFSFTTLLFHLDVSHGKFGSFFSRGKTAAAQSSHPIFSAFRVCKCVCVCVYVCVCVCFHNQTHSDLDYGIFNVRM